MRLFLLSLLLSLPVAPLSATQRVARVLRFDDPAPVNANAAADSGFDGAPNVALVRPGTWIVSWESFDGLGGRLGTDLEALYSIASEPDLAWSPPEPFAASAAPLDAGFDDAPHVASDGRGNLLAVWFSQNPPEGGPPGDFNILAVHSEDGGKTWSAPAGIDPAAGAEGVVDDWPRAATDGRGTWMIVWRSETRRAGPDVHSLGGEGDVLFVRAASPSGPWSAPAPLNSNAGIDSVNDAFPRLAAGAPDHWLCVWAAAVPASGDSPGGTRVRYSLSTDGGMAWSPPEEAESFLPPGAPGGNFPDIAAGADGQWMIVWEADDFHQEGGFAVRWGLVDRDGQWLAPPGDAFRWGEGLREWPGGDRSSGPRINPSVAFDGDSRFGLVWSSFADAEGRFGRRAEVWAATGMGFGWNPPVCLTAGAGRDAGDALYPRIAGGGDGTFLAVWSQPGALGGKLGADNDILAARGRAVRRSSPRPKGLAIAAAAAAAAALAAIAFGRMSESRDRKS